MRLPFLLSKGRFDRLSDPGSGSRGKRVEMEKGRPLGLPLFRKKLLLVKQLEVLNVDSFHLRSSSLYRRLLEVLAGAKLADGTGLLEFPLEFLQSPFDVLAFLDRNYDHNAVTTSFFL